MFKFTCMLMFAFTLLPGSVNCRKRKAANSGNVSNANFEILTLAQSWPQTNCFDLNHAWTDKTVQCSPCQLINKSGNWTLHGLWPSNKKPPHPSQCKTIRFDKSPLGEDLQKELTYKWPSYKKSFTNEGFWTHEWKKHGTCALQLEETNTMSKYFSQALQLLDEYNMAKVLRESDIVPGNEYTINEMMKAIEQNLGVRANVQCARNKLNGKQYLSQITMCLDKSFVPINCGDAKQYLSNCAKKERINYPINLRSC